MGDTREQRTLTCVNCPAGCVLRVDLKDNQIISIQGNRCKLGEQYAHQEIQNPSRIVTSLIRVAHAREPLSVKTSQPIPKHLVGDCLAAIQACKVCLPVEIGETVIQNVLKTGADVVATRSLPDRSCESPGTKA